MKLGRKESLLTNLSSILIDLGSEKGVVGQRFADGAESLSVKPDTRRPPADRLPQPKRARW